MVPRLDVWLSSHRSLHTWLLLPTSLWAAPGRHAGITCRRLSANYGSYEPLPGIGPPTCACVGAPCAPRLYVYPVGHMTLLYLLPPLAPFANFLSHPIPSSLSRTMLHHADYTHVDPHVTLTRCTPHTPFAFLHTPRFTFLATPHSIPHNIHPLLHPSITPLLNTPFTPPFMPPPSRHPSRHLPHATPHGTSLATSHDTSHAASISRYLSCYPLRQPFKIPLTVTPHATC